MQASLRELLDEKLSMTAPTVVAAGLLLLALTATGWQLARWHASTAERTASEVHPAVVSAPAADPLPVILSANVFGAAPTSAPSTAAATAATREATGFTLRAAFAGENGGGGAIIENSTGQADWYAVGQSVVPGLLLKEVHPDHVILDRAGTPERLQFERLADTALTQSAAALPASESTPTFSVEPGQPQPIPQDMAPEEKANLIRQRLEELRNRTRT